MIRRLAGWAARLAAALLAGSVAAVGVYRFVDPPLTPLMVLRAVEGRLDGRPVGIDKEWVGLERVSPAVVRSVVAAEDARFFVHHGIDFAAVRRARDYNARQRRAHRPGLRGASTITMQCARSVFLWPGRSWVRKAAETYLAALLELLWGKRRILEVYLNVVEWGDGLYGIGAAARRYFHVAPARLGAHQAALLAAALPAPRRRNPAAPTRGLVQRAAVIQARARAVSLEPLG